MSNLLRPSPAQFAAWLDIATDVRAEPLARQMAASNIVVAFTQAQESLRILETRPRLQLVREVDNG